MVKIKVDRTGVDDLIRQIKRLKVEFKNINSELNKKLPKELLKILKQETPKDTGKTSEEWKIKTGSKGFTIMNRNGAIIEFLMKGTAPHVIKPVNASVLTVKLPGSMLFLKKVNHPGYDVQLNEDELFDKIMKKTEEIVNKIVDEKIQRFIK